MRAFAAPAVVPPILVRAETNRQSRHALCKRACKPDDRPCIATPSQVHVHALPSRLAIDQPMPSERDPETIAIRLERATVGPVARSLVRLGIAIEIDDGQIRFHPAHEPLVRRAVEECLRGSSPVKAQSATDLPDRTLCPSCGMGSIQQRRCLTCYWSPDDDIFDEGGDVQKLVQLRRLDRQLEAGIRLDHCAILGGSGIPLLLGAEVGLHFGEQALAVTSADGQSVLWAIELAAISSLQIDGPGEVRSDAGFSGGGLGMSGIVEGMALAWVVNRLTRTESVATFLSVAFTGGELFLHHGRFGPRAMRLLLSPVYSALGLRDLSLSETDGEYRPRGRGQVFIF